MPTITTASGETVVPIHINGSNVALDETRLSPVINSKSNKTVHHFHSASVLEANAACDAAYQCFKSNWKNSTLRTRSELLKRVADIMEAKHETLVQAVVSETSGEPTFAGMTTSMAPVMVRDTAAAVLAINGMSAPSSDEPGKAHVVNHEPIGPVLVIPPWNAPVILAARAFAAVVGAGCTVVCKASELSPLSIHLLLDIFNEAGAPPGLINMFSTARGDAAAVTEALIAHPAIRKIDFIGSASIGRVIGSLAGKHLKPVMLELGGKCPAIVREDADINAAATICAQGATMHHGQLCVSTERIIVHRSIAETFSAALAQQFAALPATDAVNHGGAKHAHELLVDAEARGCEFLAGKPEMLSPSSVTPALVLEPKAKGARIADEETFGPSASLYVVDSDEDAIALANDSAYGWAASIHTRDLAKAMSMARELDYGMVHMNNYTFSSHANAPAGGVKGTGWGRGNARWGIEEFLIHKTVTFPLEIMKVY